MHGIDQALTANETRSMAGVSQLLQRLGEFLDMRWRCLEFINAGGCGTQVHKVEKGTRFSGWCEPPSAWVAHRPDRVDFSDNVSRP